MQKTERKDEFKEFAKIFWVVILGITIFSILLIIAINQ